MQDVLVESVRGATFSEKIVFYATNSELSRKMKHCVLRKYPLPGRETYGNLV